MGDELQTHEIPASNSGLAADGDSVIDPPVTAPPLAAVGEIASAPARPSTGESIVALLREVLETVIFALLVFLLVQSVSRNYKVQSISMQPNLYEGQYLVINRLVYANNVVIDFVQRSVGKSGVGHQVVDSIFHAPRRGEVVVLVPVNNSKPDLIKRVIGIAGDTVELRQGKLYLNGYPIDEPYIRPAPSQSYGPVTVGQGQIFVMGDNRGNSSDSRVFGMVPLSHVVGRAWLRYWPPKEWGFIRHYDLAKQLPE